MLDNSDSRKNTPPEFPEPAVASGDTADHSSDIEGDMSGAKTTHTVTVGDTASSEGVNEPSQDDMPDASGATQDDIPDDDDLVTRFAPKQGDNSQINGKRLCCLNVCNLWL